MQLVAIVELNYSCLELQRYQDEKTCADELCETTVYSRTHYGLGSATPLLNNGVGNITQV